MIPALRSLDVITVFAPDLAAARAFYTEVFGLPVIFEDDDSAVVRLENLLLNLLRAERAATLVAPRAPGAAGDGPRLLLTIEVADVDAVVAQLSDHGVALLNGPVDRPWGRRTVAFADPAGLVWEAAQPL